MTEKTREHVVARNLFDKVRIRGKAKFVLVPTCTRCNGEFASDEEDFRNFAVLAGSFTQATQGIFNNEMLRSLKRSIHGAGRLRRIMARITPHEEGGQTVHRINLIESDFRVCKKIIRGLLYHHDYGRFPQEMIHVVQNTWLIPPEYLDEGAWHVIHPDVFRYRYETQTMAAGEHSLWLIEFFRTVQIVGMVTRPRNADSG
jgi:hypothetical protein